ncbi:hypothetical protein FB451DRAFT_1550818 [Mycena latifolia]|nr:hypothetical protein FB451DRAFT_1550818 [Mycena latifolia]
MEPEPPAAALSSVSPPTEATHATSIAEHLNVLRQSLEAQVPYTGGVHVAKKEDLVIYYDEGEKYASNRIDLSGASEKELSALAAACQKATFGVEQADVLDETYRKAGKMDLTKFATRLDVVASGLINAISPDILQGQNTDGDKIVRAEMYKLNVYGPGSFFKAHKDTPRGETMIGSLVVVFPTAHTGGVLTLEHGGTTWTFDSAAELAAHTGAPALAYVAFYSDVTHAVEPVRTGYRVTLTYNLFLADRAPAASPALRVVPAPERAFETTLRALLADAAFLPTGGLLAYGLAHQYPIPTAPAEVKWIGGKRVVPPSRLGPVLHLLKGADARIRTVSTRLGLATHIKTYGYSAKVVGHDVLADDVLNTEDVNESYDMNLYEEIERMGLIVERPAERAAELRKPRPSYYPEPVEGEDEGTRGAEGKPVVPLHWVTKITQLNRVGSQYLAYGNEASIKHVYGNAALFVQVPPFGKGVRVARA